MERSDDPPTSTLHLKHSGLLRATATRSNYSDRTRRQIFALTVDLDDLANSSPIRGWGCTVLEYSQVRKLIRAASRALELSRVALFGICIAYGVVDKEPVSIYRQFGSEHLGNPLDLWKLSRNLGHLNYHRIAGFPRQRSLGAGSV